MPLEHFSATNLTKRFLNYRITLSEVLSYTNTFLAPEQSVSSHNSIVRPLQVWFRKAVIGIYGNSELAWLSWQLSIIVLRNSKLSKALCLEISKHIRCAMELEFGFDLNISHRCIPEDITMNMRLVLETITRITIPKSKI